MERRRVKGIELGFEIRGSGDPVLLIPASLLPDGFQPLVSQPSLADHHRLIRYHRRGTGETTGGPVSVGAQAADAAALLADLGIERAHVVGHSYGGLIGLQLALAAPQTVASLALLEPNLLAVPAAGGFNDEVRPAFAAYRAGDKEQAVAHFLTVVAGLPWGGCQAVIDTATPDAVAHAIAYADTFFGVEVPALGEWSFGTAQARRVTCPVLSVLGTQSHTFFREGRELLQRWFPQLEQLDIPDAGHLLHLQNPAAVASGLASFFSQHRFGQSRR